MAHSELFLLQFVSFSGNGATDARVAELATSKAMPIRNCLEQNRPPLQLERSFVGFQCQDTHRKSAVKCARRIRKAMVGGPSTGGRFLPELWCILPLNCQLRARRNKTNFLPPGTWLVSPVLLIGVISCLKKASIARSTGKTLTYDATSMLFPHLLILGRGYQILFI